MGFQVLRNLKAVILKAIVIELSSTCLWLFYGSSGFLLVHSECSTMDLDWSRSPAFWVSFLFLRCFKWAGVCRSEVRLGRSPTNSAWRYGRSGKALPALARGDAGRLFSAYAKLEAIHMKECEALLFRYLFGVSCQLWGTSSSSEMSKLFSFLFFTPLLTPQIYTHAHVHTHNTYCKMFFLVLEIQQWTETVEDPCPWVAHLSGAKWKPQESKKPQYIVVILWTTVTWRVGC